MLPFQLGPLEIIVVLVVALLVLGPKRLPEAARSVGKGMREFKDSITGSMDRDGDEHDDEAAKLQKPSS